jgi:hypothetical protein
MSTTSDNTDNELDNDSDASIDEAFDVLDDFHEQEFWQDNNKQVLIGFCNNSYIESSIGIEHILRRYIRCYLSSMSSFMMTGHDQFYARKLDIFWANSNSQPVRYLWISRIQKQWKKTMIRPSFTIIIKNHHSIKNRKLRGLLLPYC